MFQLPIVTFFEVIRPLGILASVPTARKTGEAAGLPWSTDRPWFRFWDQCLRIARGNTVTGTVARCSTP